SVFYTKLDDGTTHGIKATYSDTVIIKIKELFSMGYHRDNFDERGRYEERGCERGDCKVGGREDGNCVKHTVKRILDAQQRVKGSSSFGCENSCDVSIDALLSPSKDAREPRHNT